MSYIERFLEKIKEKNIVINYIQISKGNEIVEEYKRVDTLTRLNVYSISKSVTSLAIGIALQEKLIKLDDKLIKYFPEIVPKNDLELINKIEIKHLLTMSCGVESKLFFSDDIERYITDDWIKYFFEKNFLHEPGEHFEYCNFNTYLLSCIIERVSGVKMLEYMKPRFFEKIGIYNPEWLECPHGHTVGAYGLLLTIDEMMKIGRLLLNNGTANGEEIISRKYIEEATKNQILNNTPKNGYGYQFWVNPDNKSYRADGKYGQYIIVVPEHDLVVCIQAFDSQKFYDDVWNELVVPIMS